MSKVTASKEALAIKIEGFPRSYNQLMLKELVQSYPGLLDYRLENHIGFVKFSSHEDAEVALAGNHTH